MGYADPKKFNKKIEQWWPIEGDVISKVKLPSKARLKKLDAIFRKLGNKKDG